MLEQPHNYSFTPARYYRPLDPDLQIIHMEREGYWENRNFSGRVMDSSTAPFPADTLAQFVEIGEAEANRLLDDGLRTARESAILLVDGRLHIADLSGNLACAGILLLTNSSVFVLQENSPGPPRFSLLGAAISFLMDVHGGFLGSTEAVLRAARKNPPPHLADAELAALDANQRDSLLTTRLHFKAPLSAIRGARRTGAGFELEFEGYPSVELTWNNWAMPHIAEFLRERGIQVVGA